MSAEPAPKKKRGKAANSRKVVDIRVVSDATGGLARHIMTTVLSQFNKLERDLRCYAFCDTKEKVRGSLKGLRRGNSIVFSTLAPLELKRAVDEICEAKGTPHFDLTGGCVDFIEEHTGHAASNDVAAVHRHDSTYFDRIDALEFSLQHDDSRRLESVHEAEILLVGISRVSKTPTSAYLGWLGHRVANVSIVPDLGIPDQVVKCRSKAVALTMRPKTLAEIRHRRFEANGFQEELSDSIHYTELRPIIREVMQAEQIYRELGIHAIDTSELTIEEIAARVLQTLGKG